MLFLDNVGGHLHLEDGEAIVSITNRLGSEADRRFADETLLILLHGLMCWLVGRRTPLTRVTFTHARPPYSREYTLMYCEKISFGDIQTSMRFDCSALSAPIVQTAATLRQFLRTALDRPLTSARARCRVHSWCDHMKRRVLCATNVTRVHPPSRAGERFGSGRS